MALKPESEAILRELQRKRGRGRRSNRAALEALAQDPGGRMNEWEAEFARRLEIQRKAGEVVWWGFQSVNRRLPGVRHFYKPDFEVIEPAECCPDCGILDSHRPHEGKPHFRIVYYEVKGFLREKARNKLKLVASLYWWAEFRIAYKTERGWVIKTMKPDPRIVRREQGG